MAPLVDSSAATSLTMTIDQCFRDAVVAVIAEDGKDVIPVDVGGGAVSPLCHRVLLGGDCGVRALFVAPIFQI